MNKELMITKEDLVNWLDRPPSNDDLDLIGFIATRLENFYKLEQENKQLKEQVDRLIKKEYEKDNDYIVKVRTGEQLEREQYLLNFKSKSMLASMLIDAEEKIDKAIEYIDNNSHYYNADGEINFTIEEEKEETFCKDLLEILRGEDNE